MPPRVPAHQARALDVVLGRVLAQILGFSGSQNQKILADHEKYFRDPGAPAQKREIFELRHPPDREAFALAGRGGKNLRKSGRETEDSMLSALDELAEYEAFKRDVLPKLQGLVASGASAEDIYQFAQSMAAAKMVTIALREGDPAKAISALKDVLDRTQGKAKERTEVEHKFAKLSDNELDALLESRLSDLDDSPPAPATKRH